MLDLQTSITSCTTACATIQQEIDQLTVQQTSLKKELQAMEEALHQSRHSYSQQHLLFTHSQQRLQDARDQVDRARQRQSVLQQEKEAFLARQSLLDTIHSLHTEVTTLQSSVKAIEEKCNARNQADQSLKELKEAVKSLEQQLLEERRRRVTRQSEAIASKREEYAQREKRLIEERRQAEVEGECRLQIARTQSNHLTPNTR